MMYRYEDVIGDFAQRTLHNLRVIRELRGREPGSQVFEVTQLVNSTLGLLVFPQQKYVDSIPETSLDELGANGWPIPRIVGNYPQVENLRQLIRVLRNAIAHFNLEFVPGPENVIGSLRVWNTKLRKPNEITWMAELTIDDLEQITERFAEVLLDRETYR